MLVEEWERDPARGAYPGEESPDHDPISHLELAARCDAFCIAPATAHTIAKMATGQADNLVTAAYLACAEPGAGRAGDEQPHVRAPGDAGEPQRCSATAGCT